MPGGTARDWHCGMIVLMLEMFAAKAKDSTTQFFELPIQRNAYQGNFKSARILLVLPPNLCSVQQFCVLCFCYITDSRLRVATNVRSLTVLAINHTALAL